MGSSDEMGLNKCGHYFYSFVRSPFDSTGFLQHAIFFLISIQILVIFQAYYRQGVALQCLGRHADALAAFASGLAQDPKSLQLQGGLIEATLKSPLKGKF